MNKVILPYEIINIIISYVPVCICCNLSQNKCVKSGSGDIMCFDCWCKNYKFNNQ